MTMFAILYLLFLGCLGLFLFCADLVRLLISTFQTPFGASNKKPVGENNQPMLEQL